MTHEELKILVSAYLDGEVSPSEKIQVEEHLLSCAECQKDYKSYKAMSTSLSKWSNEHLSPDEELKIHNNLQRRREPMFTKRNVMALGTTLALTIIIGSVVQHQIPRMYSARTKDAYIPSAFKFQGVSGRLKSANDGIGDQVGSIRQAAQYESISNISSYENKNKLASMTMKSSSSAVAGMGEVDMLANAGSRFAGGPVQAISTTNYYQGAGAAYYNIDEQERKKIQRADLSLSVENAFKTKAQLTDVITQFNGIIVSSQFSRSPQGAGYGSLVCKVYPKDLEPALQQIRKLGEVETENQSSMDVTDQYADAHKNMTQYQADKERLEKSLNTFKLFNPTSEAEKANIQQQIAHTQEELKALERVIHFYQEQTNMSLVTINYHDNYKTVAKDKDNSLQWKERMSDKWKATLDSSMDVFTSILFSSLVLLSFVAPFLIWIVVFVILYFIVRMFFRK